MSEADCIAQCRTQSTLATRGDIEMLSSKLDHLQKGGVSFLIMALVMSFVAVILYPRPRV